MARSLKTRFTIAIMIALIVVLGTGMLFLFFIFRNSQINFLKEKVESVTHFVSRSSIDPILYKDILKIDAIIEDVIKDSDIVYAFVYDNADNILNTPKTAIDINDYEIKNIIGSENVDLTEEQIKKITTYKNFLHFNIPIQLEDSTKIGTIKVGVLKRNVNNYVLRTLTIIVLLTLLTIFIQSFVIYILFKNFILKPFGVITNEIDKASKGDLTVQIELKDNDEIGVLASRVNELIRGLREIILDVKKVAENTFSLFENVVNASKYVEKGAREQQKSVLESINLAGEIDKSANDIFANVDKLVNSSEIASSAVMELNQSLNNIADNVVQFNKSAKESAKSVEEMIKSISAISLSIEKLTHSVEDTVSSINQINMSLKEVQHSAEESAKVAEKVVFEAEENGMNASLLAIKGMEEIKNYVIILSQLIEKLGKRSNSISKIVSVIDEVAEQTSMLALNAAILSAQAGESGAGFSIVADNIKDLAKKTAKSTREIEDIIDSVREDIISSINMVKIGVEKVEEGVNFVNKVNEVLLKIKESSEKSAERTNIIKKATDEQATAIRQITDVMNTIKTQIENISEAIKTQAIGSKNIIDTVELIKNLSEKIKTSTEEQRLGSKQIEELILNVSDKAADISKSTAIQKEHTEKMVSLFNNINVISIDNYQIAEKMVDSINNFEKNMKALIKEFEKFKI